MSDVAIRVEGIGKQYKIGAVGTRKDNLREVLTAAVVTPFRRAVNLLRGEASGAADLTETFWALKDINLEIKEGEVVGIIGRNGAGKSTLLKVLTRITEPTTGYGEVFGRVGSLLEVGTGFHPELTGRDNIFLNGAILGMSRETIKRNLDEIIEFAEVAKFIDTPVKHYSSGMYLRLAFAVAAHLEPEILLIDEVLAVGDARFQKKCLDKMNDVSSQGRTVLFVSHQMSAITRLCSRCILLSSGQIMEDGPTHEVVSAYMTADGAQMACREWYNEEKKPGAGITRLLAVRVLDEHGEITDSIDIREDVQLEMEFEVLREGHILLPHFRTFNEEGVNLFTTVDLDPEWRQKRRPRGIYKSRVTIPGNTFAESTIFVHSNMITLDPQMLEFIVPDAVAFQVIDSMDGTSARGDYAGQLPGVVRPMLDWKTEFTPR